MSTEWVTELPKATQVVHGKAWIWACSLALMPKNTLLGLQQPSMQPDISTKQDLKKIYFCWHGWNALLSRSRRVAPAPPFSICSAKRLTKDQSIWCRITEGCVERYIHEGIKVLFKTTVFFLKQCYLFSKKTHQWPEVAVFSFLEGTRVSSDVCSRAQVTRIGDF